MKKLLALILAMLMLSAVACTDTDVSDDTSAADASDQAVSEDDITPDIPDDLKFPGETVTIMSGEWVMTSVDTFEEAPDPVWQAKYYIDLHTEERFDITLDYVAIAPFQEVTGVVRQTVNSGSEDYHLVGAPAQTQVHLINEGMYHPVDELKYIDLDKPWWNREYIESVSFHKDELYVLFGDITYNTLERSTCVFFNIQLLDEKLGMQPEDLYNLVYEGKWTIDKFTELVSQVYEDDGNTLRDGGDTYGLVANWEESFNWMAYGAGLKFSGRDENGYPVINMYNEKTVDLVDKLCRLFFNNEGTSYSIASESTFGNGQALFVVNRFFLTSWEQFRTMEDDYGLLPIPKYDESIEGYHSPVESLVWWTTVPVTISNTDMSSAIAEYMSYEGRLYLRPAYYETTLKLKQTRDEESMKMIDLIMAGRETDYLYINSTGEVGNLFKTVFRARENNFASEYAKVEKAGQQVIADLIKTYEESH